MRTNFLFVLLLISDSCFSQPLSQKLEAAISILEKDPQFKNSIVGMYVAETATGKTLFEHHAAIGLAPASCQKIITSVSAFELLGRNFRYETNVGIINDSATAAVTLYFWGNGDPTLGSQRYASASEPVFMALLKGKLSDAGIRKVKPESLIFTNGFSSQIIPDGWVWQDIGNYFGAGSAPINWRENQFSLIMAAGDVVGKPATLKEIRPAYTDLHFKNECTTGPKKSGDNAYIYSGLNSTTGFIRGSIPEGENNFSISGAVPEPSSFFLAAVKDFLDKNNLLETTSTITDTNTVFKNKKLLYSYLSPVFDSINYWFLKKSINLYGEALVKSIAQKKGSVASTDSGINIIREFWAGKGIPKSAMKIIDGSGLSPANRVTTMALVEVLRYAKQQPWFPSFYNALPEMNNIKMKDGYIGGVRSYTGFIKAAGGKEYSFAFIVNNFDGSPATAREKIWQILDLLK